MYKLTINKRKKLEAESNNHRVGPFKVIRKDGTIIMEFEKYYDASEFSIQLNNLYKENKINDEAEVISNIY